LAAFPFSFVAVLEANGAPASDTKERRAAAVVAFVFRARSPFGLKSQNVVISKRHFDICFSSFFLHWQTEYSLF